MFGTTAGVVFRTDVTEIARRRACSLGSLTELALLDALLGLPVGLPVAVADLTDVERRRLDRVPAGAVDRAAGQLVRRAVAPVSVQLAVVGARDWRLGLKRAGQFAPFCARAILLPTLPADAADLEAEASYYGVGVCRFVERQLQMLIEPRPYVRNRHTAAQWWFAEQAFEQFTESEIADEPARR